MTAPVVTLNEEGICNFCLMHDELEKQSAKYDFEGTLCKIRKKKGKYNCLIGISGGLDSSVMLEYAVKKWGLRPLVIHFDNGWNVHEAEVNMNIMTSALGVDKIRYTINRKEYDNLCKAFLWASVSDADIPNDMVMAEMMMRTADHYGIKYILNGHNFRTEGSSPLGWSYMDSKYLQSVYSNFGFGYLTMNLLTFKKQLRYALKGIKHIRPMYYQNPDMMAEKARLIEQYGWRDYGAKHAENIYTWFIGGYYLPIKFGIDKRLTYMSAMIRSKLMPNITKLNDPLPPFNQEYILAIMKRLDIDQSEFDKIMHAERRFFTEFSTYHGAFRRWKWLLWIGFKLGLLPYTFYKKYVV